MSKEVLVNGVLVGSFDFEDGVQLWDALSEANVTFEREIVKVTEERLGEWQDLPDENIESLLEAAKEKGFIENYELR